PTRRSSDLWRVAALAAITTKGSTSPTGWNSEEPSGAISEVAVRLPSSRSRVMLAASTGPRTRSPWRYNHGVSALRLGAAIGARGWYSAKTLLQRPPVPARRTVPRRPAVLWIWSRGDACRGFQRRPEGPTVQQTLQEALQTLGLPHGLMPSGRTDRGVHARMQVVSLRLPADLELDRLPPRLAEVLPSSMGVTRAVWAPKGFHAQWSATGKAYHYRLAPHDLPPAWAHAAWELRSEPRLEGARVDFGRLAELLGLACGT